MIDGEPFLPQWAEELGICPPAEGEPFRDYWLRIGFPPAVVDEALTFPDPRMRVLANQRMVTRLRERHPAAFTTYVENLTLSVRSR